MATIKSVANNKYLKASYRQKQILKTEQFMRLIINNKNSAIYIDSYIHT